MSVACILIKHRVAVQLFLFLTGKCPPYFCAFLEQVLGYQPRFGLTAESLFKPLSHFFSYTYDFAFYTYDFTF